MSISSVGVICRKLDFQRLVELPAVAEAIRRYRAGDASAKKTLPAFSFHASFPHGRRKSAEAEASGLYILDFDHLSPAEYERIRATAIPLAEEQATSPILLVHTTPSGHGLRIVAKATRTGEFASCRSISDFQHTLARQLHAEPLLDDVVHDLARLSFCPQAADVHYLSDRLFDEAPEVVSFAPTAPTAPAAPATPAAAPSGGLFSGGGQSCYEGVPLSLIFRQYIEQTGGMPHEGARNSRFYAAARDLRYICDFNPAVLSRHLPDVGLPASEIYSLCLSACQSSRAANVPDSVVRAVVCARALMAVEEEEIEEESAPEEECALFERPPLVRELLDCTPVDFQEATLLALLPIVGTLATRIRAEYLDGEIHSPSFFTIVSSEQASGKSFARRLVRLLLRTIAEEDERERQVEAKFKEQLRVKKNAKELPQQPRVKIRLVPATISVAKLLQRIDFAEGDHLFSFAEEMDTLIKSNKSGCWAEKNDLYRNAFDNSVYGQDYMSESSYSANLPIFYNLLVLGTPRQTWRFFRDVENGLPSRCCFATLPDQFGARMPHFGKLTEAVLERIERYVERLRAAYGLVDLSFLFPALSAWLEEQRLLSLMENNRARDIFRRRSAVIGFRAALAFSPLFRLSDPKSREQLSDFCIYIASVTLKNQINFAGPRLNEVLENDRVDQRPPKFGNIFSSLSDSFTAADVQEGLRRYGMRGPVRTVVYLWRKAGLIEKTDKNCYVKTNGNHTAENQDE